MPATAAIDNETLDHLLSVVDDFAQCRACGPNWKGGTLFLILRLSTSYSTA